MTLRIGLLALLVLLATAGLAVKQQEKGSIEGLVVRIGTDEPLEDTRVELSRISTPGEPSPSNPPPAITTGNEGKFFFKDLRPGAYRLRFTRNGYVRQEFGQRAFPGSGLPVNLASGQELRNVVIAMSPTGSISGRVRDRNGDPLVGVPVQLMTYRYDSTGQKVLQAFTTMPTDKTNDRGEYRIFYVTPGKYYVKAGTPTGDYRDELPEARAQTYSNVFYPAGRDFREASTIDVRSGSDLRGIDFTLATPVFYRVRGRIVDSRTGLAPAEVQVKRRSVLQLTPSVGDSFLGNVAGFYSFYDVVLNPDGTLFVDNIVPGQYRLEPRSLQSGLYVKEARFGGVDALNRPIRFTGTENGRMEIVIGRTSAIVDGRVTDGKLAPVPYASVVLVPDNNRSRIDLFCIATADETGHFNIPNIVPGNYKIFSWDQLEPYAYFDPDLLRRSEPNGKAMIVTESSRQTVDLKIIADAQ